MPNHVHVVFVLTRNDVGAGLRACPMSSNSLIENEQTEEGHPRRGAPTDEGRSTLPDVVYRFKSWTTKLYSGGVNQNGWAHSPENMAEELLRKNHPKRR